MSKKAEEKAKAPAEKKSAKGFSGMVFLVFGVLIVAGIVALTFVSNTVIAQSDAEEKAPADVAVAAPEAAPPEFKIKEGNPVVAKMGQEDITRQDVLMFIAQLPPQMRQQPIQDLFPLALEQTINAKILEKEAEKADFSKNEEVIAQVEEAKKNIVRTAYVQKVVNDAVTEEAINAEYEQYKNGFEGEEETRARHILVETEEEATALIKQLDEGADFETLAKENSTGPSAPSGGDLGYFVKGQMVPEFSDAAAALDPGQYTKNPVKTQFGYHVVKVEDRRMQEPQPLEEIKPYIEQELKRNILDEKLQTWRKDMSIEKFDINGDAVQTSATEAPEGNEG